MTKMTMALVIGCGCLVGSLATAEAQVAVRGVEGCEGGTVRGDLGISGLDCRGDCTLTLNERGEEQFWSFSVEPRILGVAEGGPADGVLEVGDAIVAIDGVLITTSEGGRRFASVEPGQAVRLRVRRGWYDEVTEVTLRAGASCTEVAPPPLPAPTARPDTLGSRPLPTAPTRVTVGRLTPPVRPDSARVVSDSARGVVGVRSAVLPRVRVTSAGVARGAYDSLRGVYDSTAASGRVTEVRGLSSVSFPDRTPRARLGIGMSCSECGTRTDEETGREIWFFSGPVEVTSVEKGGAADLAGVRIGDLITAIDGKRMETEDGGRAFSDLEAGKAVSLTVIRRNGQEVQLRGIPREPDRAPLAEPSRPAAAAPTVGVARPAPLARPGTSSLLPFELSSGPPLGMPLRYSGTVEGVEIEVRGEPVAVGETREEGPGTVRTVLIQADGLWIRIRIPM